MRKTERLLDTKCCNGYGNPVRSVGLIASSFRPSDDTTTFESLVPSNFMAVKSLRRAAEILEKVNGEKALAKDCLDLADEVEAALKRYAVVRHPVYGEIYAFEVDGFGKRDPTRPDIIGQIRYFRYLCNTKKPPSTMNAITRTDFAFEEQKSKYTGKVRDVYDIDGEYLVMVVTDRISAFDVVLPEGIPYKGQVLNQIAAKFLDATADILPNWKIAVPDPMVTVGRKCEPFKVEMVIRGYLSGHAWREYKAGKRTICGEEMPEGMVENQKFPEPIITPTSKAAEGHDEDISKEEIIASGLVSREEYEQLEKYTQEIFRRGSEIAARMGLILVDTKYEFGKKDGVIYLMDEIHTPDSSRYFYADGYAERLAKGERQKQLSKEFVREWLMANGFQGQQGQQVPEMTPEIVAGITDRYVELYEKITGEAFVKAPETSDTQTILRRIEKNVSECLKGLE